MESFTPNDYERARYFAQYAAMRGWGTEGSISGDKLLEAADFVARSKDAETIYFHQKNRDFDRAFESEIFPEKKEDPIGKYKVLPWSSETLFHLSGLDPRADQSKNSDQQRQYWLPRIEKLDQSAVWLNSIQNAEGISENVACFILCFFTWAKLPKKIGGGAAPQNVRAAFSYFDLKTESASQNTEDFDSIWVEGPSLFPRKEDRWMRMKMSKRTSRKSIVDSAYLENLKTMPPPDSWGK